MYSFNYTKMQMIQIEQQVGLETIKKKKQSREPGEENNYS